MAKKTSDSATNSIAKKAVIYARYSSHNQKETSIEIQLERCKEYAHQHGYDIVDVYKDKAQTGRNSDRPALLKLKEDSKKGRFSIVLIMKIDRWFRNVRECLNFMDELQENNVAVISITEGNLNIPSNKLMFIILAALAEQESDNISERVKAGRKKIAEKAGFAGGKPPLGYDVKDRKYVINDEEARIVTTIFKMYADGHTQDKIVNYLNDNHYKTKRKSEFAANSLQSILHNKRYTGRYVFGEREDIKRNGKRRVRVKSEGEYIEHRDAIPRIVSDELFEKVQRRLEENKLNAGRTSSKEVYLLSGIISCGVCGAPMYVNPRKNSTSSYYCSSRSDCNNPSINRDDIENYVVDHIYWRLFMDDTYDTLIDELEDHHKIETRSIRKQISHNKKRCTELESDISIIKENIALGQVTKEIGEEKLTQYTRQLNDIQQKIAHDEKIIDLPRLSDRKLFKVLKDSMKLLLAHNTEHRTERLTFIKRYVKSVKVFNDHVEIRWKLRRRIEE